MAVPKFTVAVATVPLPIMLVFMPVPTHLTAPLTVLQTIVFPTAVSSRSGSHADRGDSSRRVAEGPLQVRRSAAAGGEREVQ